MKRPEVSLQNYKEVYDFYRDYSQPRLLARTVFAALSAVYRPHVQFEDGAIESLHAYAEEERSLILTFNHLTRSHDQFIAAATQRQESLRHLIGHTRALAKDELFRTNQPRRAFIDAMGSIPVFRSKNYDNPADEQQLESATHKMLSTAALRLASGDSIAVFPEGTANDHDPTKLLKITTGAARIAHEVTDRGGQVAILPVGLSYGPEHPPRSFKHASVFVGAPIDKLAGSVRETTEIIASNLQHAVTIAHKNHHKSH